jgi:hypothetical protein
MPTASMTMQDGIRAVQQAINDAPTPPRWPMYVRQAKQFLRTAIEGFDERKYGFQSVVDLLRAAGRDGVLRIERDRQGAIRVFPGSNVAQKPRAVDPPLDLDETVDVEVPPESVVIPAQVTVTDESPVVDAEVMTTSFSVTEDFEENPDERQPDSNESAIIREIIRPKRGTRSRKTAPPRTARTTTTRPRARKRSSGNS